MSVPILWLVLLDVSMNDEKKAALIWAKQAIAARGYKLKSDDYELIKSTPWSTVMRFETNKGNIYLKQMPEKISFEPDVIHLLDKKFKAQVPEIIAQYNPLHCFLMKDAGRPLRDKLKEQFASSLLCEAVADFTALQLKVSGYLEDFFALGVPDWRLGRLTELYRQVVNDDALLISEGLSIEQIKKLQCFECEIIEWAAALAKYQIPYSMIQPDFHDNNVLIDDDTGTLTWIDLGEILISHPFFPLFNYLWQIKKHHGLREGDSEFDKIKNLCFRPYQNMIGSSQACNQAITIAEKLYWVYSLAYQYRFMIICGKNQLVIARQWRLKDAINNLMQVMMP